MAKVVEGQNKINTAINYLDQQLEKMSSTNQYRAMLESQRKTLYDQWHEMNKLYTEVNTKYLIPSAERAARVSSVEAGRTLNVEAAEQKLATAKKGASEILPEGKDLKEVSSAKQAEYLEAQQLIADAAKETEKAAQAKLKTLSKGRTPATTQPDVAAASERAQTAAAEAQQAQATIQKAKKAWVESGQALAEKRLKDVEEARKAEDALIPIEYYDIAPAFLSSQENRVLKNQVLDALEARRAAAVGARTEAENARRYLKELGGTSNPGAASRLQDQIDRANKALDDINIDRRLYGFPPLSTQ